MASFCEGKVAVVTGAGGTLCSCIAKDLALIKKCAEKAVECALAGIGGVIGQDENKKDQLRACEFERIKGGKPFDVKSKEFVKLLAAIGQA